MYGIHLKLSIELLTPGLQAKQEKRAEGIFQKLKISYSSIADLIIFAHKSAFVWKLRLFFFHTDCRDSLTRLSLAICYLS
jgi:hypothetical protein